MKQDDSQVAVAMASLITGMVFSAMQINEERIRELIPSLEVSLEVVPLLPDDENSPGPAGAVLLRSATFDTYITVTSTRREVP